MVRFALDQPEYRRRMRIACDEPKTCDRAAAPRPPLTSVAGGPSAERLFSDASKAGRATSATAAGA
jgi:hypothetical protein